MSATDELKQALTLEQIEVNLFLGRTPAEEDRTRIFGGQVVAQALLAGYRTVENRICHSLQSYFIRPGDPGQPVLYQVEHSRNGKSFSTRRVIAIQKGEQIFNMACSFQEPEDGFEHQDAMPDTARADSVPEDFDRLTVLLKDVPAKHKRWLRKRAIEMRPIDPVDLLDPKAAPASQMVWIRSTLAVPDDAMMNQVLLAYSSDYSLLGTGMRPHGVSWMSGVQTASLDHIIWFHRPTDFSRWHLYVQDSPSASGARGFNRGSIFRDDGVLVASTAQEGLMRQR